MAKRKVTVVLKFLCNHEVATVTQELTDQQALLIGPRLLRNFVCQLSATESGLVRSPEFIIAKEPTFDSLMDAVEVDEERARADRRQLAFKALRAASVDLRDFVVVILPGDDAP